MEEKSLLQRKRQRQFISYQEREKYINNQDSNNHHNMVDELKMISISKNQAVIGWRRTKNRVRKMCNY